MLNEIINHDFESIVMYHLPSLTYIYFFSYDYVKSFLGMFAFFGFLSINKRNSILHKFTLNFTNDWIHFKWARLENLQYERNLKTI